MELTMELIARPRTAPWHAPANIRYFRYFILLLISEKFANLSWEFAIFIFAHLFSYKISYKDIFVNVKQFNNEENYKQSYLKDKHPTVQGQVNLRKFFTSANKFLPQKLAHKFKAYALCRGSLKEN